MSDLKLLGAKISRVQSASAFDAKDAATDALHQLLRVLTNLTVRLERIEELLNKEGIF
jgi:hypothetical protein